MLKQRDYVENWKVKKRKTKVPLSKKLFMRTVPGECFFLHFSIFVQISSIYALCFLHDPMNTSEDIKRDKKGKVVELYPAKLKAPIFPEFFSSQQRRGLAGNMCMKIRKISLMRIQIRFSKCTLYHCDFLPSPRRFNHITISFYLLWNHVSWVLFFFFVPSRRVTVYSPVFAREELPHRTNDRSIRL